MNRFLLGVVVLGLSPAAVCAPRQLASCAGLLKAEERLACYDEQFPPERGSTTFGDEQRAASRASFGLPVRQRTGTGGTGGTGQAPATDTNRLESSVTGVVTTSTGERVLSLANGQVWRVLDPPLKGPLREGDPVTVRRAALGAYMVITPAGVALRTRRVR